MGVKDEYLSNEKLMNNRMTREVEIKQDFGFLPCPLPTLLN